MLPLINPSIAVPGMDARIFIVIAFTAAAAYYDVFKNKWVPNALLYAFLACAFAVNLVYFEQELFISAVAFGAAMFLISYPLYKAGQLGGADVFCYSSIAMAIPYLSHPFLNPSASAPYPFILSVLVPAGIAFIAFMFARFVPYIYSQARQGGLAFSAARLAVPAILLLAFVIFFHALSSLPVRIPFGYLLMLVFLFAAISFFSLFKQEIKDSMVESVPLAKLQEEDVLALEKMDSGLVARLKLQPLINGKTAALLAKAKLRAVPVYTRMPCFLPYLLFGVVFTILFGDLISYVVPSVA